MRIQLLELAHQRKALDDILAAFPALDEISRIDKNGIDSSNINANPLLQRAFDESDFIDVKMETGTGKTYTYTRMMFELHERLGLFKFIVVVPSIAIKEGAKSFLAADYARQHFAQDFPEVSMTVDLVNSGDFSAGRSGRKGIPNSIREFAEADSNNKKQIYVLLLSDKGFLDKPTSSLFKDDYDVNLFGGASSPVDMLADTRPIVIIDEPHRLKRDGKSYQNIINRIRPEMIIRFGATFPQISEGRGRNRVTKTDYYRGKPQHDLTAVDAFNQDLVKGVRVEIPQGADRNDAYKVASVTRDCLTLTRQGKTYSVNTGESLANIDNKFPSFITYQSKTLSNNEDFELPVGMTLIPGNFMNSYQELLIDQALNAHFDSERENFLRDGFKVKTNALFFIESRKSYREETWLTDMFDGCLKQQLVDRIEKEENEDYKSFLQATLDDIPASRGGYFSGDSNHQSSDDKIAEETDVILRDKSKSLGFKDETGKWNTLRFFFSQWALREGWDNPNVFTICKLRSSGSETSKIQEVGRGLRLPVDEMGNRLSDEEWYLNFVVDESERDFAESLTDEINSEAGDGIVMGQKITEKNILQKIAEYNGLTPVKVINKLSTEKIIDGNMAIIDLDALRALLPPTGLKAGKVKSGKTKSAMVKLNKQNWLEIKDFWMEVSQRYMLQFDDVDDSHLRELFEEVLSGDSVFDNNETLTVDIEQTKKGDEKGDTRVTVSNYTSSISNQGSIGELTFGEFVRKLCRATNLPMILIYKVLSKKLKGFDKEEANAFLNDGTMTKIVERWQRIFVKEFSQKYRYNQLDFTAKTSVLKNAGFVDAVSQGTLGTIPVSTPSDPRNLFEAVFVDSEVPEKSIAEIKPEDEIKVFGKIPRRAIQVPLYTGGTTTPDFVYATKGDLYLLVEAKAEGELREAENIAVDSQKNAFKLFKDVRWKKVTSSGEVHKLLAQLVTDKSEKE
jgi:type III restriction enzyme